jgi:hypothetical protein
MRILEYESEWSSYWDDKRLLDSPLWPYLDGSELAPATAKRGELKKVRRAASMVVSRFWARVWGMCELVVCVSGG